MKSALLLLFVHFVFSCSTPEVRELTPPKNQSRIVALKEAYLYGYPLVTMEMARRVLTNVDKPNNQGFAPINQFAHRSSLPTPETKDLLNPNLDILYSSAFLDLESGPLVLTIPHNKKRYFMLQVMNGWTDMISSIGTHNDLEDERVYFIHGPQWRGIPPKHMKVVASSTNINWILGRTYVKDHKDLKSAQELMSKFTLRPVRKLAGGKIDLWYKNKTPDMLVEKMDGVEFFNLLNLLLLKNLPNKNDHSILEKLAKIGIGRGLDFNVDNFSPEEQRYLSELPKLVSQELVQAEKNDELVNGWDMNLDSAIGRYGTNYALRARIALVRLGMPVMEDAVFPEGKNDSEGAPLSGQFKYMLHFDKGQTPPARAFWSLTAYGSNQLIFKNSFNQYKLDNHSDLLFNPDGSLDIYIQNETPVGNKVKNWLPIPRGLFTVQARIYWPEAKLLTGTWTMPSITKQTEVSAPNTAESEIRIPNN